MKNILILTDFSQCSRNAIQYAINFLKNDTCLFYVMHVHKSGSFTTDDLMSSATANVYESILKVEKERLEKLKTTLEEESLPHHTFETILEYNNFIEATQKIITANNIELLVAGFNGVSNASEILFGSHTLSIIRKINCKTLVIPENVKFHNPKTLLIPLDAKDDIQSKVFMNMLATAKNHKMHVHILRVYEKGFTGDRYDESYLLKHCKDVKYTYHAIENVLLDHVKACYVQLHKIDMIGLLVQKESIFERLFKHSSTTAISKTLKRPLLVEHV
ncbi:universal stress protein [Kordia algicida OT-1]|uniref:Universal stress protein n=1 Tax=Kordia algicida OT-1 TaxID=391587 RepID=A9DLL6_9FLAO|nr:universal stress protein [Kordia algicida]EDP98592.1 universal stress protein [Kordia algicida OT-1]